MSERSTLRSFDVRLEFAHQSAAHHVALEADVVAGGEHRHAALAIECLAAPKNADADHRLLAGDAQSSVADVLRQVVKQHYLGAAEHDGADDLLCLFPSRPGSEAGSAARRRPRRSC